MQESKYSQHARLASINIDTECRMPACLLLLLEENGDVCIDCLYLLVLIHFRQLPRVAHLSFLVNSRNVSYHRRHV